MKSLSLGQEKTSDGYPFMTTQMHLVTLFALALYFGGLLVAMTVSSFAGKGKACAWDA